MGKTKAIPERSVIGCSAELRSQPAVETCPLRCPEAAYITLPHSPFLTERRPRELCYRNRTNDANTHRHREVSSRQYAMLLPFSECTIARRSRSDASPAVEKPRQLPLIATGVRLQWRACFPIFVLILEHNEFSRDDRNACNMMMMKYRAHPSLEKRGARRTDCESTCAAVFKARSHAVRCKYMKTIPQGVQSIHYVMSAVRFTAAMETPLTP